MVSDTPVFILFERVPMSCFCDPFFENRRTEYVIKSVNSILYCLILKFPLTLCAVRSEELIGE